ncbi:uncharacterized protein K452DRAFT_14350 [Aplosporella prunicola CBS 121167]|uniref:Uncharacterized protein n=1 Tax=Aplosporella prunicola CBS 121167 TaxID=1176127 RepID=A0A6A6BJN5_9PEZI|nr:uncharacterized protein K452DRAFT_14350 [Aplosporella prunicola CBS 121167]KAF2143027.1 hypothetical protein K452DRAFT_14350 [Aplosporella prunicola CBS 121167]
MQGTIGRFASVDVGRGGPCVCAWERWPSKQAVREGEERERRRSVLLVKASQAADREFANCRAGAASRDLRPEQACAFLAFRFGFACGSGRRSRRAESAASGGRVLYGVEVLSKSGAVRGDKREEERQSRSRAQAGSRRLHDAIIVIIVGRVRRRRLSRGGTLRISDDCKQDCRLA